MSKSTSTSSSSSAPPFPSESQSKIPITPGVLRAIFASSRTPSEERSLSRRAFFNLAATRWKGVKMALIKK
ncbi:hypothetical protein Clacol_001278 [Clathrus columnatus]|uniref:Uncharacterized protein n=1 Tax=Clathrus columnatus TaxID=1419009 RepID=A0AAV4ZXZ3_9AGAM|nr:hypothetical protein Clacol_001278 [Clathrus columnatus]